MSRWNSCTVYLGNLPNDIREREHEDLFYKDGVTPHHLDSTCGYHPIWVMQEDLHKYGRILDIDLKSLQGVQFMLLLRWN